MAETNKSLAYFVKSSDIVNRGLWRLFPVINIDYVKDIPYDYPGPMGVPITFMDKWNNEQFQLLGLITKSIVNGKEKYKRMMIRNLKPALPEYINLQEWLDRCGSPYEVVPVNDVSTKHLNE